MNSNITVIQTTRYETVDGKDFPTLKDAEDHLLWCDFLRELHPSDEGILQMDKNNATFVSDNLAEILVIAERYSRCVCPPTIKEVIANLQRLMTLAEGRDSLAYGTIVEHTKYVLQLLGHSGDYPHATKSASVL